VRHDLQAKTGSLEVLGLTTFKGRRWRGDLIEAFKILKNILDVDYQDFFQLAPNHRPLRGHTMKLFVPQCRINVRSKFFSQWLLKDWNSLSQHIIDADMTNTFQELSAHYLVGYEQLKLTASQLIIYKYKYKF